MTKWQKPPFIVCFVAKEHYFCNAEITARGFYGVSYVCFKCTAVDVFCRNAMKKGRELLLVAIMLLVCGVARSQVVINEIMQSNVNCLMENHQFPDSWVELYNEGDGAVSLSGYRLGEKNNFEKAYKLPDIYIPAGSYRIIYCDKEAYGCHTDFALEPDNGSLYLFDSAGMIVDALKYRNTLPVLPADISYGRSGGEFGYLSSPTPGAPNADILYQILPQPLFSKAGRVYPPRHGMDTIVVSMPAGVPDGTKIHYTLDGSEPDEFSLSSAELTLALDTTTVVRARLMAEGYLSPYSVTQSYIFHPRELTLPVVSLVTDSTYFYDEECGILASNNFKNDWYRPVNVEFFDTVGRLAAINQLSETRVQGGGTRVFAQKSLALYGRKHLGNKKFQYQFWPDDKPDVTSVKSFILRNAGNDCIRTHLRDAFAQYLFASNVDNLDWQAYVPSVCYINGVYKGIYNIRERSNDDYVLSNYEDIEDFDMIENWTELKSGDFEEYNRLRSLISDTLTTYADICKLVDVDNFMKMFLVETWCFNEDFPGNNIVMWRPRSEAGKWRWILKDLDFVGLVHGYDENDNYFDYIFRTADHADDNIIQNSESAVELFKFMMSKDEFREKFIDALAVYMGDFLRPDCTIELFNEMSSVFASEYPHHLEAYDHFGGNNVTMSLYKYYFDRMVWWLNIRNNDLYNHLSSYFNLGKPVPLAIDCRSFPVEFNGVALTRDDFDGKYFTGRELKLANLSDEETAWRVIYYDADSTEAMGVYNDNLMSITIPDECCGVHVELLDRMALETVDMEYQNDFIAVDPGNRMVTEVMLYDLSGLLVDVMEISTVRFKIAKPKKGIYILKFRFSDGSTISKKVLI